MTLTVRETRHGPLVSDVSADAAEVAGSNYALAFAWTSLRDDDLSLQAGLDLNQAQNWNDFTEALRNFHAPQQNIVYADVDGNIGMYAPARVPIRKNGDGLVPVPGWTGDYDWTGFVPFEKLPHVYNPPSGQIVTANNKLVPDSYPYFLTSEWAEPYRVERITALLAAQKSIRSDLLETFRLTNFQAWSPTFCRFC